MGEAIHFFHTNGYANGFLKIHEETNQTLTNNHEECSWYEEVIDDDLKWSFALKRVLHKGISDYQEIALLDTKRFGKVLVIDGKMQSAEADEFIYHECLIHPALICHPEAKTVFIMGGGEGSAAREALKHKSLEKVVMCDIDQEVVDFCRRYLTVNQETFCHKKLNLVINDAKAELEKRDEKFDIIVGDLADPVEGGPCYQLYTKSFYEKILKPKLNENGIFVTQMFCRIGWTSGYFHTQGGLHLYIQHNQASFQVCGFIHSSRAIFCRYMGMGHGLRPTFLY
ncbi:hypothetical protein ACJW30_01G000200 [Castanea mollissima]